MKRIVCSALLVVSLLLTCAMPAFAEVRTAQTYTTSAEGIAFIDEMMGGSYGGTSRLASAESTVNSFLSTYGLSLSQTQFDALVDLVMAYGSYILTSGYKVEKLIGSGSYTDVEIANAFCSWVKDGSTFSQDRLNRRLREIKLFLYGSYDGVTSDVTFRYVIFYPNGGSLNDNTVLCFSLGESYGKLPTASRSGKYFAGWYTAASGGTHLCNTDVVSGNQTVYAHWSDSSVDDPNEAREEPTLNLRTSDECIGLIKLYEGFSKYAVWDYGQYSIGYGTQCDPADYPNGITEEEADYLLRVMVQGFEKTVEKVEAKRSTPFSQCEFDALISFTFNLGSQWIGSSRIYQLVTGESFTELQLVNAMGSWAGAGGSILTSLMRRRMDEANIFLNGSYVKGSTVYFGICFNAMGGEVESRVQYYITGEALGSFPTATRSGYRFVGWFDKAVGGTQYTASTVAPPYGTVTLYAHWEEAPAEETPTEPPTQEPTEPTEPNEPTETSEPNEPNEPNNGGEVNETGFTDVPKSKWYYEYILKAVESGLFSGMRETEFWPEYTMNRAMLVTVLYRLAGSPTCESDLPFTDVEDGLWYTDAVRWAYQNGIVTGITETYFGVEENITREQLTTMLYRYATVFAYDTSAVGDLSVFPDASLTSEYAKAAMQWAVGCGIVNGVDGRLEPTGEATRAQCAKMMVVFEDLIK